MAKSKKNLQEDAQVQKRKIHIKRLEHRLANARRGREELRDAYYVLSLKVQEQQEAITHLLSEMEETQRQNEKLMRYANAVQMVMSGPPCIDSDADQDLLDTPLSLKAFRGTDKPTAVDKGKWLDLYRKANSQK